MNRSAWGVAAAGVAATALLVPLSIVLLADAEATRAEVSPLERRSTAPVVIPLAEPAIATEYEEPPPPPPPRVAMRAPPSAPPWPACPFCLRGRLVGLDPSIPWRAPIFVLPIRAAESSFVAVVTPPAREPRRRRGLPVDDANARTPILDYDPLVAPPPRFEELDRGDPPVHARVDAQGFFALDLRELFQRNDRSRLVALDLIANDPLYMPERQRVAVPAGAIGAGVTLEVSLPVRPAAAVTGLVDAPGRGPRPSRRGLDAIAGLFQSEHGEPVGGPVDVSFASDRYHLRAPQDGDYVVIVALRDHEPVWERAPLAVGRELELPRLRFAPGSTIDGRIELPARDLAFDPNLRDFVRVVAELEDPGARALDLPDHALAFVNGHLLVRRAAARGRFFGPGGAFTLRGVREGRSFRVRLDAQDATSAAAGPMPHVVATAPARDVVLSMDAAYVGVDVSRGFRPLAGADVTISAGSAVTQTGADGRAGFFVPPDRDLELLVNAKECEPARASLHAGPVGSLVRASVELKPIEPGARLRLELDVEGMGAPAFVRCSFERVGGGVTFFRDAFIHDGVFEFTQLPAGLHEVGLELVMAAGRGGADEVSPYVAGHWLIDRTIEVELIDQRAIEQVLSVRRGGKLRPRALDAAGSELPARCELRDAHGSPVAVSFVVRDGEVAGEACESARALPPGSYAVTFRHAGFEPATVEIEVRAGEVTDAEATLRRSR